MSDDLLGPPSTHVPAAPDVAVVIFRVTGCRDCPYRWQDYNEHWLDDVCAHPMAEVLRVPTQDIGAPDTCPLGLHESAGVSPCGPARAPGG